MEKLNFYVDFDKDNHGSIQYCDCLLKEVGGNEDSPQFEIFDVKISSPDDIWSNPDTLLFSIQSSNKKELDKVMLQGNKCKIAFNPLAIKDKNFGKKEGTIRISYRKLDYLPMLHEYFIFSVTKGILPPLGNCVNDGGKQPKLIITSPEFTDISNGKEFPKNIWITKAEELQNATMWTNIITLKFENQAKAACKDEAVYIDRIQGKITESQQQNIVVKNDWDKERIKLSNGSNPKKITFSIDDSSITIYDSTIKYEISFEYWEDKEGNSTNIEQSFSYQKKTFQFIIALTLKKVQSQEWLCIDFGTSAIVAAKGKDDRTYNLIDLYSRQTGLFECFGTVKEPRFEAGSKFISSTVMLREGEKNSDDLNLNKVFVLLSPPLPVMQQKSQHVLPPIKSLLRYSGILNNMDIQYKHDLTDSIQKSTLSIEDIIKKAYSQLFKKYIEQSDINENLIITVPNTFTPFDIKKLKDIARSTIGDNTNLKVESIPESDAVALFYAVNRGLIFKNRTISILTTEHVLVYDMGAGTLDLTYFEITKGGDGKRDIELKKKIGTNKAGNYFDYIIADALCQIYKIDTKLLKPGDANTRADAAKLKEFICKEVKPNLNENKKVLDLEKNNILLKYNTSLENIELDKIKEHECVKQYIKETTEDLLITFLYGKDVQDSYTPKLNYPIGTVVFSGRGSQYQAFKDQIKNFVTQQNNKEPVIIDDLNISNKPDNSKQNLKSAVVLGAISYASVFSKSFSKFKIKNKNIHASYGFLYLEEDEYENRTWKYYELLNPDTKATGSNEVNGICVYTYDTDRFNAIGVPNTQTFIDISSGAEIHFIQSYSLNPAQDWDEENKEYITKIFSFDQNTFEHDNKDGKIAVRITVDGNNEMAIHIGGNRILLNEDYKPEVEMNAIFEKSMWPYW
jgi:molecular chaperone DnaK (HSP70)